LIVILPTVAINSHLEQTELFINDSLARTEHPSDVLCMLILEFS